MSRTMYMLVAFDGTDFHGWQDQAGVRTVQAELEEALRRVIRHPVSLVGSGRTDAGVHAAGHVSSFTTTCTIPDERFRHAIGSRLPKDLSIIALRQAAPTFDARHDAVSKLYRYRIYNTRRRPVQQALQRRTYHYWKRLDVGRMREGAKHFIGEKDFRAMASSGDQRAHTVRTILRCDVFRHLEEVRIDVEGTGFLYNQVRNMVGTLLDVGRGAREPQAVAEILASGDRNQAGQKAPAHGLCLQWVNYPPRALRPPPGAPAVRAGTDDIQMPLES